MTRPKTDQIDADAKRLAREYARAYYRRQGNAEKRKGYTKAYWRRQAMKQATAKGTGV